jgi:hypothetical protein
MLDGIASEVRRKRHGAPAAATTCQQHPEELLSLLELRIGHLALPVSWVDESLASRVRYCKVSGRLTKSEAVDEDAELRK